MISFKWFGIDFFQLGRILMFGYLAVAPMLAVLSLLAILFVPSSWVIHLIFWTSVGVMVGWRVVTKNNRALVRD